MHIIFAILVLVVLHFVGVAFINSDPFGLRPPAAQVSDTWYVATKNDERFGKMWEATYNGKIGYGSTDQTSVERVVSFLNANGITHEQLTDLASDRECGLLPWLDDVGHGRETEYHRLPTGINKVLPAIHQKAFHKYVHELAGGRS